MARGPLCFVDFCSALMRGAYAEAFLYVNTSNRSCAVVTFLFRPTLKFLFFPGKWTALHRKCTGGAVPNTTDVKFPEVPLHTSGKVNKSTLLRLILYWTWFHIIKKFQNPWKKLDSTLSLSLRSSGSRPVKDQRALGWLSLAGIIQLMQPLIWTPDWTTCGFSYIIDENLTWTLRGCLWTCRNM